LFVFVWFWGLICRLAEEFSSWKIPAYIQEGEEIVLGTGDQFIGAGDCRR